ncbi:hypothetical protein LIER_15875 [Lithospermum erythrorhizon]|uniref:Zinc knuckle CX2CX4HX4C domain-containing protein n=1 Tax=Lithospermum erythrorhizon TaxID=34254 RepID=A0AAV3Q4J7_LITER
MSIANVVGTPLRVDPNNLNRTKLNSAHVCVELDVAAPLIDSVWVGFEDDDSQVILDGIWIKVFYDVIPPFCTSCYHIGHAMGVCKRNKLEVTHSIGAETGRMASADKAFDKIPHPKKTTAPQVQAATSSMQVDQVAAGGDMNSKAINQTNKPATLVMQNSCDSCSVVDDLLEQIGAVQVEASEQIAATLDQPIPKPTRPGVFAAKQGTNLDLVPGASYVPRSESQGAQIEADFGGAEVYVGAGMGNTSEVEEVQVTILGVGINTLTARAHLVEKEGRELVQIADSLEEVLISKAENIIQLQEEHANNEVSTEPGTVLQVEAHIGGAVIVDDQHTKDGQIVGPSTAQVIEKRAQIRRDISSVGFSTPEKGCNFIKVSTPSSWADQVEEEERQEKKRSTTSQGIPQLNSQELVITGANNSAMESKVAAYPHKGVIQTTKKVPTKKFHSDLPIDFDPMMCNKDDDTKEMSWSQLISGSIKLVARRSVSPVGRSSEKLKKLRNRVDFLDHKAGKAIIIDKEEYLEENEEFFKAVYHKPRRGRDSHPRPHQGRERGRGRGRGFGRGYGPDRFIGRGRTRDGRERTIIC